MANTLDLEEQEQLDQIKHFWRQYGNVITWALILVLAAFAAYNGYNYYQRNQASQAAALFDELERSLSGADATKVARVFSDMQQRFAGTTYAWQSGLLVASHYAGNGNVDAARTALAWVAEKSSDAAYQALARLRLSAVLMDSKDLPGAMSQLQGSFPTSFAPLVADRQGDILALQGKRQEAIAAYQKAWRLFDPLTQYRALVAVKLAALGVNVSDGTALPGTSSGK